MLRSLLDRWSMGFKNRVARHKNSAIRCPQGQLNDIKMWQILYRPVHAYNCREEKKINANRKLFLSFQTVFPVEKKWLESKVWLVALCFSPLIVSDEVIQCNHQLLMERTMFHCQQTDQLLNSSHITQSIWTVTTAKMHGSRSWPTYKHTDRLSAAIGWVKE